MNKKTIALLALTAVAVPAANALPKISMESVKDYSKSGLNLVKDHPYITADLAGLSLLVVDFTFGDRDSVKDFFVSLKNREFKKALELCKEDKKLGLAVALIVGAPVANLTVKSVQKAKSKIIPFLKGRLFRQEKEEGNVPTEVAAQNPSGDTGQPGGETPVIGGSTV